MFLRLIRAEWGCPEKKVDVTARVETIWTRAPRTRATPDDLRADPRGTPNDPCPGNFKELKLFFENGDEVIVREGEVVPAPDQHVLGPFDRLLAVEIHAENDRVRRAMSTELQHAISRGMGQSTVTANAIVKHAVDSVPNRAQAIFSILRRCLDSHHIAMNRQVRAAALSVIHDRIIRQQQELRSLTMSSGGLNWGPVQAQREQFLSHIDNNVEREFGRITAELDLEVASRATRPAIVKIKYGDRIRLQHCETDRYLASLPKNYVHVGSSHQQMVVGRKTADAETVWVIHGPDGEPPDSRLGQEVKHGDLVRLTHEKTARNLHSHASPAPIAGNQGQREVTAYGDAGIGNGDDNWRVDLKGGTLWSSGMRIRLEHSKGWVLHSHTGKSEPELTNGEQEVTCFPQGDANDFWIAYAVSPDIIQSTAISREPEWLEEVPRNAETLRPTKIQRGPSPDQIIDIVVDKGVASSESGRSATRPVLLIITVAGIISLAICYRSGLNFPATSAQNGTPSSGIEDSPLATWDLGPTSDQGRISAEAHWPFVIPKNVRFEILNVSDPSDLSQVRLCLKEVQRWEPDEVRSDTFGDGDIVNVNGPSRGGDYSYYVSPVSLPGGTGTFLHRYPAARVLALQLSSSSGPTVAPAEGGALRWLWDFLNQNIVATVVGGIVVTAVGALAGIAWSGKKSKVEPR
jgi:MIR domain